MGSFLEIPRPGSGANCELWNKAAIILSARHLHDNRSGINQPNIPAKARPSMYPSRQNHLRVHKAPRTTAFKVNAQIPMEKAMLGLPIPEPGANASAPMYSAPIIPPPSPHAPITTSGSSAEAGMVPGTLFKDPNKALGFRPGAVMLIAQSIVNKVPMKNPHAVPISKATVSARSLIGQYTGAFPRGQGPDQAGIQPPGRTFGDDPLTFIMAVNPTKQRWARSRKMDRPAGCLLQNRPGSVDAREDLGSDSIEDVEE